VNAPETVAEQVAGRREPTQFGRLLDELAITSIAGTRRTPGAATAAEALVPVAPRPPLRRERAVARISETKPGAHHPWKRGFRQRGDKITEQLE